MIKACLIPAGSQGPEHLQQVERPEPPLAEDEIRVRMRAASINYRDQLICRGEYFGQPVTEDTVPLSDGAGEVVQTGAAVTRFRVGDRVIGTFFRDWIDGPPRRGRGRYPALGQSGVDGVLAEQVAFREQNAVPVPVNLSYEEAACLPCAALTAWNSLVSHGRLRAGQSVLALGTGGVSVFALQFAKAAGARALVISSSDDKLRRARSLGADDVINYCKTPDWDDAVLDLTRGEGVDHIIEIGGAGTLARSIKAIGVGGNIALIGFLAGNEGDTAPYGLMGKWARLQGIFVGNRAMFEHMNSAIEVNAIRPVIDRTFPFDQAIEAMRYHYTGGHFGKVVIRI